MPEGYQRLEVQLQPGEMLVFHGHLIHGSLANRSAAQFRRSFLFTYIRQGVEFRAGVGNKRQRLPRPAQATLVPAA